jgi:hypothetical protein
MVSSFLASVCNWSNWATICFWVSPPLIVWGSGATIPFGLPSMEDLNKELKDKIDGFDMQNDNLEIELGKEQYQDKMPEIKKIIWEKVNQADISVLEKIISNNTNVFKAIETMINKFTETHPQVVNIVTTNYDRVLEYIMSYNQSHQFYLSILYLNPPYLVIQKVLLRQNPKQLKVDLLKKFEPS